MQPLSLDDLYPIDEYQRRRAEFFQAHGRYVDRYRRVRLGPRVSLIFENRQTIWFRVQEVLRVARLTEPDRIQHELNWYNALLPGPNAWQAGLLLDVNSRVDFTPESDFWRDLTGGDIRMRIGSEMIAAELVTCRPEDRAWSMAHWLRFPTRPDTRSHLADFKQAAAVEIAYRDYHERSLPLTANVRHSLLDDLAVPARRHAA